MDKTILQEIGLTDSEINVYLALLELGSSSTGKIVEKSKASSSKIYEILDRLMQKGLASFIIKSGVKHYEAAPPNRIMDYMKEKEERISSQKNELKKILPELEIKRTLSKYKSDAQIYKGLKGAHAVFYSALDLLNKGDEMLVLGVPKRNELFNRFFIRFGKERANRGIFERRLVSYKAINEPQNLKKNFPLGEIKPLSEENPAAIGILGNRVVIFPESREAIMIMIDNKEVADSFKSQFEKIWNNKVTTFEGLEDSIVAFESLIDSMKKGDEWIAFVVNQVSGDEYLEKIIDLQKKRGKKGLRARAIFSETAKDLAIREAKIPFTKTKIVSSEFETPSIINVAGNTTLINIPSEELTVFKIESKEVANSFRSQFEKLWNQKTFSFSGVSAMKNVFREALAATNSEETTYVYGASTTSKETDEILFEYNQRRAKKGVNLKIIFNQDAKNSKATRSANKKFNPLAEIKFTDMKTTPAVYEIFPDRVIISTVPQREPVGFVIINKELAETFRIHFFELWDKAKK